MHREKHFCEVQSHGQQMGAYIIVIISNNNNNNNNNSNNNNSNNKRIIIESEVTGVSSTS